MIDKKILMGAAILILLILAYYYYYSSSSSTPTTTVTTQATPTVTTITTPATGTTPGTTVPVMPTVTPVYKMSNGIAGGAGYSPNCSGTLIKDYCVLREAEAISKCSGDPSCTGYGYPSGSQIWKQTFPNSYHLYSGTIATVNPDWTSWVKQ